MIWGYSEWTSWLADSFYVRVGTITYTKNGNGLREIEKIIEIRTPRQIGEIWTIHENNE